MIIDDKGKLFGKISIIDILVVCVVLAGIAGAYYKFGGSNNISLMTKLDKIETVFYAEDLPEYISWGLKQGDLVRDRVTGSVFGKVKEVVIGPNIFYAADSNGKMVKSSKEGCISLKLVVEGEGKYSDNNGVTFNNVVYYVYKQFEIRAGNTALYPRIQSIKKIKE